MSRHLAATVIVAIAAGAVGTAQTRSARDGVFTAQQARRGQETFQRACASCHKLADQSGKKLQMKWGGTTLDEMFSMIAATMPEGNPGGLRAEQYASVIAFFLKETGYPAGPTELPDTPAALKTIRLDPLEK